MSECAAHIAGSLVCVGDVLPYLILAPMAPIEGVRQSCPIKVELCTYHADLFGGKSIQEMFG